MCEHLGSILYLILLHPTHPGSSLSVWRHRKKWEVCSPNGPSHRTKECQCCYIQSQIQERKEMFICLYTKDVWTETMSFLLLTSFVPIIWWQDTGAVFICISLPHLSTPHCLNFIICHTAWLSLWFKICVPISIKWTWINVCGSSLQRVRDEEQWAVSQLLLTPIKAKWLYPEILGRTKSQFPTMTMYLRHFLYWLPTSILLPTSLPGLSMVSHLFIVKSFSQVWLLKNPNKENFLCILLCTAIHLNYKPIPFQKKPWVVQRQSWRLMLAS